MKRLQFCLVAFTVLALTFGAFAQVQNGQFTGTVTDPSGAAIANARITVINSATQYTTSTTTNASGNYAVKELPVGSYKISIEAPGFKTESTTGAAINAGTISHADFKLQIGKTSEVVEVTGAVSDVNTEDSKLATTVSSTQINNLPLNGRNVFDLMTLSAGAVNVAGVDFENGHQTVVNGVREDFNGFLINGVSNKGLSGGVVNVPIQDSVEEFQQLQLNMSAQYGNSAGGTVNLVTKSGTNAWHGSGWEYIRNDVTDANYFFLKQQGIAQPPTRFNQFGATLGGPLVKDKLFFFLSLQGDRYKSQGLPINVLQDSQAWEQAVAAANTGLNSTASLLYGTFPKLNAGTPTGLTGNTYVASNYVNNSPDYSALLCPTNGIGGFTALQHQKLMNIFGVTAQDLTNIAIDNTVGDPKNPFGPKGLQCGGTPLTQNGTMGRDASMQESSASTFGTQTQNLGNLFNGNEASLRVDYNWNASNRLYINYNYLRETDKFGPSNIAATRGFTNPQRSNFPAGTFSFVHTFSPSILNEFRAGYLQNNTDTSVSIGGVPQIHFSNTSQVGFGSYNGYPQNFKENIYTYSDMVSIGHGNHNFKMGVDFRRNIENSEFNVGRSSYYFYDQVFFAADAPYYQAAGVDPGICKAPCPVSSYNPTPSAQLSTNVRHWRNLEFGAYFQDDWKVTKRLTLNLGLRYDVYQRHKEEAGVATTFILGDSTPNPGVTLGSSGGILNRLYNANNPGTCDPTRIALAQLVGGCSPTAGGFAPSSTLGQGDHNNFGPRVGFAWDVFGDGKTSLRGGFGVAYEGTLYNPLSNSRWNLPYYSFNSACCGTNNPSGSNIVYGPSSLQTGATICLAPGSCYAQDPTIPVTFTGCGTNIGNSGPCAQAQNHGNIEGWDPGNQNAALLTGIVFPQGVRDPYVYNFYLDIQREIMPKTVIDVKYVGTAGHKLFRAEDINRQPGSLAPAGSTFVDNFGRTLYGLSGRLNGNYGRLRVWENQVNSNYNSFQGSLKRQMSHGVLFNLDYTYSHSIDDGSTWHSGATTANGAAGGEGFTSDQTIPGLDRGNSIYDIRHRLVFNYVWQLPGQSLKGAEGAILGGWSLNGIWQFQSGAHFEPFTSSSAHLREPDGVTHCTAADASSGNCVNFGGDFNLDGGKNDRPNSTIKGFAGGNHSMWADGFYAAGFSKSTFSSPTCLGCSGNLGRNTFVGPGNWYADMTMSKTFKFTERVSMKFDANAFNVFNRTNFILATAGGGANNKYTSSNFGQAAGTLNPRVMQFGVKFAF